MASAGTHFSWYVTLVHVQAKRSPELEPPDTAGLVQVLKRTRRDGP